MCCELVDDLLIQRDSNMYVECSSALLSGWAAKMDDDDDDDEGKCNTTEAHKARPLLPRWLTVTRCQKMGGSCVKLLLYLKTKTC